MIASAFRAATSTCTCTDVRAGVCSGAAHFYPDLNEVAVDWRSTAPSLQRRLALYQYMYTCMDPAHCLHTCANLVTISGCFSPDDGACAAGGGDRDAAHGAEHQGAPGVGAEAAPRRHRRHRDDCRLLPRAPVYQRERHVSRRRRCARQPDVIDVASV